MPTALERARAFTLFLRMASYGRAPSLRSSQNSAKRAWRIRWWPKSRRSWAFPP